MKEVEIPGLGVVEFPDGMSDAAISAKAAELMRGTGSPGPSAHPWVQVNEAARAGQPIPGADAATEEMRALGSTVGSAILPTAGMMVGGALLGPPGAAGGSLAGEGINQLTGITDPSATGLVTAAAAPRVGDLMARGVNAGARALGGLLPGSGAALREMAAEQLAGLAAKFRQTPSADELYGLVRQFNPPVAMPSLASKAKGLLDEEQLVAAGLDMKPVAKTAQSLGQALEVPAAGMQPGEMAFDQAFLNLKRIGGKVRETRIDGGEEHGAWKAMFRAGMDDLDAAVAAGNPAMPAVQALKAASNAAKREFAAEDIATLFDPLKKGSVVSQRGDGLWTVDFRKALRALRQNEDFRRALSPAEMKSLIGGVEELAKRTPALPPNAGAAAGSRGTNISIAAGGALGGGLGMMVGQPAMGMAAGAGIGAALPAAIGKFLVSDTGRQFLMGILSGTGGVITPNAARLMVTAAATSQPGREGATMLSEPFTGR